MTDQPRGLLLVTSKVSAEDDEEFNRWYNEEHVPERMSCPGFLGARRFVTVEGEPSYLALYELETVEALSTPVYREYLENPTPWTTRLMGDFVKGTPGEIEIEMHRTVYREIPIGPGQ